mmetsp:Transcript_16531/g.39267  ORF Transcript_16531/g.39267 Transcript_16531/m.39267 type:complete len:257 (-) Transcript_16531:7-777(-)
MPLCARSTTRLRRERSTRRLCAVAPRSTCGEHARDGASSSEGAVQRQHTPAPAAADRLRGRLLDGQEELELCRELLLRVQAVGEVDAADTAVRVNLHAQSLDVVCAIRTAREIRQVELNLVPALIQPHRHSADERLNARGRLVVRRAEPPVHVLVIQHSHLEREVLLQILDDHDEEGQLDAKRLLRVSRARDVRGAHVGARDLQHRRLDVRVGDALDVAIAHLLIPDLQRLAPDGVEDGQETGLEGVLEHGCGCWR